jgi:hypothetical protein
VRARSSGTSAWYNAVPEVLAHSHRPHNGCQALLPGPSCLQTYPPLLAVDDDPQMHATLQAMLDEDNYPIPPANNGEEALRIRAARQDRMIILLCSTPSPSRPSPSPLTLRTVSMRWIVLAANGCTDR